MDCWLIFSDLGALSTHCLEASATSWEVHTSKPSTHVLTPPKLGALREVARDNIELIKGLQSCFFQNWLEVWTQVFHFFFRYSHMITWQAILSRKLTTASQYCLSIGRSASVLPVVPVTDPAAPVEPCRARLASCGESTDAVLLIPAPPLLSTICKIKTADS